MKKFLFNVISSLFVAGNVFASGFALDLPLERVPGSAVSVKFLIEHRSALNGRTVTAQGFVQETIVGEAACPTCPADCGKPPGEFCPPCPAGCAQPRVFLVDALTTDAERLMVLVAEADQDFRVGEWIRITGTVHSSPVAVYIEKIYE